MSPILQNAGKNPPVFPILSLFCYNSVGASTILLDTLVTNPIAGERQQKLLENLTFSSDLADNSNMAGSYFELLTEQEGIPTKPFSPVEELQRLRRGLTLRLQTAGQAAEQTSEPTPRQTEIETKEPILSSTPAPASSETESVSLEAVMKKTGEMKKTLAIWQRSRLRTKTPRNDIFRGSAFRKERKSRNKKQKTTGIAQFLTTPQEATLETVNAGLMALGIVGVIFGVLSFFRGMESDLTIGSLVCTTGAAIVVIGLGGRLLASR